MRKKDKDGNVKFTSRRHSPFAVASIAIGITVLASVAVLPLIASRSHGAEGVWIGAAAAVAAVLSVVGFIFGAICIRERDIHFVLPIVSIVINGIVFLVYFRMYVTGVMGV